MALIRFFLEPILLYKEVVKRLLLQPMLLYKRRMIYAVLLVTLGLWLIPRLPFPKPAPIEETAVTGAARESAGRPAAEPAGPPPATGGVGEKLVSGGLEMTVMEVRRDASAAGVRQAGPGRVYVIVKLSLRGTTAHYATYRQDFLSLRDQQGRGYPVEPRIADQLAGWLGPVGGFRVSDHNVGFVHFEVRADASGLVLQYDGWDLRWDWMRFRVLLPD